MSIIKKLVGIFKIKRPPLVKKVGEVDKYKYGKVREFWWERAARIQEQERIKNKNTCKHAIMRSYGHTRVGKVDCMECGFSMRDHLYRNQKWDEQNELALKVDKILRMTEEKWLAYEEKNDKHPK